MKETGEKEKNTVLFSTYFCTMPLNCRKIRRKLPRKFTKSQLYCSESRRSPQKENDPPLPFSQVRGLAYHRPHSPLLLHMAGGFRWLQRHAEGPNCLEAVEPRLPWRFRSGAVEPNTRGSRNRAERGLRDSARGRGVEGKLHPKSTSTSSSISKRLD